MRRISKEDVRRATCGVADCTEQHDPLFILQRCHTGEGLDVLARYEPERLEIRCHVCGSVLAIVELAETA